VQDNTLSDNNAVQDNTLFDDNTSGAVGTTDNEDLRKKILEMQKKFKKYELRK